MKTKSLKRDLKNTKLVVVIFCVSIAIVGSILLSLSFAALPEVNAGVARPGVPIPTQGAYFGGINKENIPSTYQIQTTPGCTDTSDQWKILECKIAWAGRQQGLAVPTDYAANMEHFFTSCDTGNSTLHFRRNL
jgi:hypothetical protein